LPFFVLRVVFPSAQAKILHKKNARKIKFQNVVEHQHWLALALHYNIQ